LRFGTFHLMGTRNMDPAPQRFDETIEQIVLAEQLGFEYAWLGEHHFSNYGYSTNPFLTIAKAAALTTRIRFSQGVNVTPLWHPIRLAEDIAVTDILTHGRLDVGLGRGYAPVEFWGMGTSMEKSRAVFAEQYELLLKAWTEEDFTYRGEHFQIDRPITVLPRPYQAPHPPIWLAAQSTQSVKLAAQQGNRLLLTGTGADWDQLGEWTSLYRGAWLESGRPTDQIRIGVLRHVYAADSEQTARAALWQTDWVRTASEHLSRDDRPVIGGLNDRTPPSDVGPIEELWDRLFYGTPARLVELHRQQAALGVTDCLCWFDLGGLGHQDLISSMRLFATDIIPALAEASVS
jgi:alkanesulfonate monooxygenase SsuD/methylene tetrahydromethanopterin reductase-like flavin-dependent oxidoreductase (luciferase family)